MPPLARYNLTLGTLSLCDLMDDSNPDLYPADPVLRNSVSGPVWQKSAGSRILSSREQSRIAFENVVASWKAIYPGNCRYLASLALHGL
jgi:hypothetical protein